MKLNTRPLFFVLLAASVCFSFHLRADENEKPKPSRSPDGRFVFQIHERSDAELEAGKPACTILERATKKQVWPTKADAPEDISGVTSSLWSPDSKRCALTQMIGHKVEGFIIYEWNGKVFVAVSVDTSPVGELLKKALLAERIKLGFTDKAGDGGRVFDGLSIEKWVNATSFVASASKERSLEEGDNRDIAGAYVRALMQWDATKSAFVFAKELPEEKK